MIQKPMIINVLNLSSVNVNMFTNVSVKKSRLVVRILQLQLITIVFVIV